MRGVVITVMVAVVWWLMAVNLVHALTGKPLRWYKTAHEYPSFEGSADLPGDAHRRMS